MYVLEYIILSIAYDFVYGMTTRSILLTVMIRLQSPTLEYTVTYSRSRRIDVRVAFACHSRPRVPDGRHGLWNIRLLMQPTRQDRQSKGTRVWTIEDLQRIFNTTTRMHSRWDSHNSWCKQLWIASYWKWCYACCGQRRAHNKLTPRFHYRDMLAMASPAVFILLLREDHFYVKGLLWHQARGTLQGRTQ